MSKYLLVLDYGLIADIPIWCKTALSSTFNVTFTGDTPVMSFSVCRMVRPSEGKLMAQELT